VALAIKARAFLWQRHRFMKLSNFSEPAFASPLGRLDARWKLFALTVAVLCIAFLRTPVPAGSALVGALFLAGFSRLPFRWVLRRLAILIPVFVFFLLSLPFLGLGTAGVLGAKALAIFLVGMVLFSTSPFAETLKAAHVLRVPDLLIQIALLSHRYVFVLSSELARLRIALRVRGYRNRPSRHSYRTVGHVAGTLLVRGYERAERVGQAMRCRGFDGRFRSLTDFRTTFADCLFGFVVITVSFSLLAWDFSSGR
jgi:cobalt/nickel transport system permease protein